MHVLTLLLLVLCLVFPDRGHAKENFDIWVANLRVEAMNQGISESTFDSAFETAKPLEDVIRLDRAQPESTRTFKQYITGTVSAKRIRDGKNYLRQNRTLLSTIEAEYGVPAQYIIALWGMETDYGRHTGNYNIIEALATLAYDGRRAKFFRAELMEALKILEMKQISLSEFQGSWAGAMGQCQFMPSSYQRFAVDYDKDGHADIWNNKADVFASIANYLRSSGWKENESWGKRTSDDTTPSMPAHAKTITVGDDPDDQFDVTSNYAVILKWNKSRYFATSVGLLADAISKE